MNELWREVDSEGSNPSKICNKSSKQLSVSCGNAPAQHRRHSHICIKSSKQLSVSCGNTPTPYRRHSHIYIKSSNQLSVSGNYQHHRHHKQRRGKPKSCVADDNPTIAMPPSAQADFARRLRLRRRASLKSVCTDSCVATQLFFGARSVDIMKESSDMEKPTSDSQHSIASDDQLSLPELAGLISRQLDDAIERGLYNNAAG